MNKIKSSFKKILSDPLGFSASLSIITLILGVILYRPFFEENDDVSIALIAEGAYGKRDFHLVYCNVILGKLVSFLSSVLPSVRWHTVLQYAFMFLAMLSVSFVLAHYKNGRLIATVIQLSCFYELYVSFQYTKNAVFISIIGIFLVFHHLHLLLSDNRRMMLAFTKKGRNFALISGYVLLLYGMLLRNSSFYIAVAFALIPGFLNFLSENKKPLAKKLGLYVMTILPVFAVLGIVTVIDNAVYNSDPQWAYFKVYNEARTDVVDYKYYILDYEKYGDGLSDIGVSENDAYMYVTWQFGDESVVTPDLYNKIVSLDKGKKIDIDLLKAWVADVYKEMFVLSPLVIAACVICLIMTLISDKRSMGFISMAGEVLLLIVMSLYFEYSGRWSHRLIFSALIAMFVILACFYGILSDSFFTYKNGRIKPFRSSEALTLATTVGIILIAAFGARLGNEFDYQEYLRSDTDFEVLQMYMEQEKDKLFVADTFTAGSSYKYNVFKPAKEGALDNYLTCGGWLTGSPIYRDTAEKYGYYNPFDALKRGDNVVLIDNTSPDRKAIFLSEHGKGPRYAAEYVETVSGYNLYKMN